MYVGDCVRSASATSRGPTTPREVGVAIAHPSRYFIHYLLSHGLGAKPKEGTAIAVVSRLGELGLPVPQDQLQLKTFLTALELTHTKMKPPPG